MFYVGVYRCEHCARLPEPCFACVEEYKDELQREIGVTDKQSQANAGRDEVEPVPNRP